MTGLLCMFTIYKRPLDYPDAEYVVRQVNVDSGGPVPGEVLGTAETLDEARGLLPPWADVCWPRDRDDEPHIVETWM